MAAKLRSTLPLQADPGPAHRERMLQHFEQTAAEAQGFGDEPSPLVDHRHAYQQRPQLTELEIRVLAQIRRSPMQVTIIKGVPEFWVKGRKIRRDVAEHLIRYRHVIADDPGLFADSLAQTYRAL